MCSYFEILTDDTEQIEAAMRTMLAVGRKKVKMEINGPADYLHLPGWRYVGHIKTSKEILIVARSLSQPSHCPRCGCPASMLKPNGWTRRRCLKDEPRGLMVVRLYFLLQRYLCRSCKKPSQQPMEGIAPHRKVTERLLLLVHREIFRSSFAVLAQRTGIGEQTVHNIFTDFAEELAETVRFETPRQIGIDGVYIENEERCIVVDLIKGRPIALLPAANYAEVSKFFMQLPNRDRIELVAMDMSRTFAAAVYEWLPRAGIVIDTYHFQRMVNQGLHEALRQLRKARRFCKLEKEYRERQKEKVKDKRGKVRRTRFILFKRRSDLTEAEEEVLKEWIEQIPELGKWHDLKEKFLNIFQLQDGEEAERRYDEWEQIVERELPGAFRKLRTAIKNWRRAIFNYFDGRVTNARTEAVNSRIKELQYRGRGYKFEVVKALILYAEYKTPPPRRIKKRKRLKPRPINPHSKVGRLRRAFEAQDQTLGLIPDPAQYDEWQKRFNEVRKWLSMDNNEVKPAGRKKINKSMINDIQGTLFRD